jgi:hypothetical protein
MALSWRMVFGGCARIRPLANKLFVLHDPEVEYRSGRLIAQLADLLDVPLAQHDRE